MVESTMSKILVKKRIEKNTEVQKHDIRIFCFVNVFICISNFVRLSDLLYSPVNSRVYYEQASS